MKKGDLVKYRKYPYYSYHIYRIKEVTEKTITLVPGLNYTLFKMIEIPYKIKQIPELFCPLTNEEIQEFEKREFEHACYQACTEIDLLEEKLESLNSQTDSHRINGEISITLNKINTIFNRIGGNYELRNISE